MFRKFSGCALALTLLSTTAIAQETSATQESAATEEAARPNILVIWGDDVGMWNISAYHRGMMCCGTPNIDRIANDGMLFMDHYAQASCTAGRAAFITGQYPLRVGLATVGLAGSPIGLQAEDPTLAEMLKPLGYRTAQFGKNHLGDLDEHLPTAHGFDEFYGILYHLNAGEYVEQDDYPTELFDQAGIKQRGVIHSYAAEDGGEQRIEDLGNFGREWQRTLDQDVLEQSKSFITEAAQANEQDEPRRQLRRDHRHRQRLCRRHGRDGRRRGRTARPDRRARPVGEHDGDVLDR